MKATIKLAIAVVIALALTFGLVGGAVAAPAANSGPPVKVTIVALYPQGQVVFSGIEGEVEQIGFVDSGLAWQDPTISYYVNLGKQNPAFLGGIVASFEAWNQHTTFTATYEGSTRSTPGILQAKWNRKTGTFTGVLNVVGWRNLDVSYPGAIGVTYIWSSRGTLVEVDTALNSSSQFRWWQTPGTSELWPSTQTTDAYDVDVQNIMTHEAGHWLVLDDIYDDTAGFVDADAELTMYGYAGQNELKKRSLETGDIAGIQYIYSL